MDKIIIEGGRRLEGEIPVSGAKNAALPAIAAALLCPGRFVFKNVPDLRDINTIAALLMELGAKIGRERGGILTVDTEKLDRFEAPYDLVRTMRASCLVLGPLIARMGRARASLPGGCAIGERPIDLHIRGFQNLGCKVTLDHGYVEAVADEGLKGSKIHFDTLTVTGTENLMMAATAAEGPTVLENAASEPEVVFLADMLNKMGADIKGAGTGTIVINGGAPLKAVEVEIIPDRVEAGTFMTAAAITGGHLKITRCNPGHLEAITLKLVEIGCNVNVVEGENFIEITGPKKPKPVNIDTAPYPGFPTDMQAQIMAVLAMASGNSVITETIFENRYMHVAELRRMGAKISVKGRNAVVTGVEALSGAEVMATDLRASASLIIAALAAKGQTVLRRVYHLDRGYQKIEEKLGNAGAEITREAD